MYFEDMSAEGSEEVPEVQDCAVCLQKCNYPTQLPCGHIFCFLCVKGVAIQNKKCAMCRAEIPPDYLDHPLLLQKVLPVPAVTPSTVEYQWYYEGRNGWWRYDERSNSELEAAFAAGEGQCKLLLAGALYVIDFQNMIQVQTRNQTRRRRVKRDTPTLPAKGVAGIKIVDLRPRERIKSDSEEVSVTASLVPNAIEISDDENDDVEIVDDENDDEPISIVEDSVTPNSSFDNVVQIMSSIDLQQGNDNNSDGDTTEDT